MLYMATGKPALLGCKFLLDVSVVNSPISSRQHNTEQDSDYQQLHNDRTIYYWHI